VFQFQNRPTLLYSHCDEENRHKSGSRSLHRREILSLAFKCTKKSLKVVKNFTNRLEVQKKSETFEEKRE
jgi:hypothetical protein